MKKRNLGAVVFSLLIFLTAQANTSIEIRLSHNTVIIEESTVYVDVEVRSQDRIVLAGQNYRVYYPTDLLSIDSEGSNSKLSTSHYAPIKFSSIIENASPNVAGGLSFDQDLGMINFNVELVDLEQGGQLLSGAEWTTLVTLKFDLLDGVQSMEMIWGRMGKSEQYATAFVEIAEWTAPMVTNNVYIEEYTDYEFSPESIVTADDLSINIGPNPTSDVLHVSFDHEPQSAMEIEITDLSGKTVRKIKLEAGTADHTFNISDLPSASYVLALNEIESNKSIHVQTIVVAQK